jgi:3-dehydroquinate synthase
MVGARLDDLTSYLPLGRTIVITDQTVGRLYGRAVAAYPVITIGCGEGVKQLDTVQAIYAELLRYEADRSFFLLGLGGGIVGDITGFVAATYLRGLRFGLVPTTLLAQVDAAIGGKNGVNFDQTKNMIGTIWQPDFVLCDEQLLATLPVREFRSGLAEVIKHALIADEDLLAYLEPRIPQILAGKPEPLTRIIHDSIMIKSRIVSQDETETGERRKLNFGHTVGHALELAYPLSHGEAISIGMGLALELSAHQGRLHPAEVARARQLLRDSGLPLTWEFDPALVMACLKRDKKRQGEMIQYILLSHLGQAVIEKISLVELAKILANWARWA